MSGRGGSAGRAAAGALRLGRTVGAALSDQRVLEPAEARLVAIVGILSLGLAVIALLWPLVVAIPLSILLVWIAVALLMRAHRLRQMRRSRGLPTTRLARRSGDGPP